ncbi:MAG: alpha/beta hydrolase family protein [Alphaproteobacteria bacterium]|nr:alpha/beta hydrolase family protein [Alphaproteobacteria bacterium]
MTKFLKRWLRGRPVEMPIDRMTDGGAANAADLPDGLCLDIGAMQRRAAEAAPRLLAWTRAGIDDPLEWQAAVRLRLAEISGYGLFGGPPGMLHCRDHDAADRGGLHQRSIFIRVRDGRDIPVRLVWSAGSASPEAWPVALCLQGDGRDMATSWVGAAGHDGADAAAEIDFARQAARRGYLAVCVELPGAGLRQGRSNDAVAKLAVGGSMLGDAASDVASVVNWLTQGDCGFPIDLDRIAVIGHGSGAAVAVLTAAMDARCSAVVAAGGIGPHRATVGRQELPLPYVVPGLLQWMDMEDVVALCAPRPVLILSAEDDPLWPASGGRHIVSHAGAVYERLGATQAIAAKALAAGQCFDENQAWDWLAAVLAAPD